MEAKNKGNKLFSLGKLEEAIKAYSEGVDLIEADDEKTNEEDKGCLHLLYANRSMAHMEAALPESALQDAECCIDTKPEFGKGYLRRASALIDFFQMKDALDDLDKAEELDPGLAPLGCESRLRAAGKKWVHNCYLKKQKRLQKELKCDYVVMGELNVEGADPEEVVFPLSFGALGVVLKMGKTRDMFSHAEKKGEIMEGMLETVVSMFQCSPHTGARGLSPKKEKKETEEDDSTPPTAGGVKKQPLKKKKKHSSGQEENDSDSDEEVDRELQATLMQPYVQLIREQLKREYGPTKHFELIKATEAQAGNALFCWAPTCWLWRCLQLTRKDPELLYLGKRKHRIMFPGAPKWIDFENPTQFRDFVKWEMDHPRPVHLKHDGCSTSLRVEEFEQRLQEVKEYRTTPEFLQRREDANSQCMGCGATIADPDPQECLCGDIYCSYSCHKESWDSHQSECRKRIAPLRESHKWTVWYWRLVSIGYFPRKDEAELPNSVWAKRGIPRSKSTWDQEVRFYSQFDRDTHNCECDEINRVGQQKPKHSSTGVIHSGLLDDGKDRVFTEFLLRQVVRNRTPIPLDSPARLYQKFLSFRSLVDDNPMLKLLEGTLGTTKALAEDFAEFATEHLHDEESVKILHDGLNTELSREKTESGKKKYAPY